VVRDVASRRVASRLTAALGVVVTFTGLVFAGSAGARPAPPPNPSDQQISQARGQKDALANRVGQLSGQIAQAKVQLGILQGKAELAEQKYAYAVSQLQIANHKASQAKAQVHAAATNVVKAHARFIDYVQSSYMSGDVDGTAGTLLTAPDPSALLEQSALEQYQQQHQADAIGALQGATVAKSNADAKARLAVINSKAAKVRADEARIAARTAFNAEQAQAQQLQVQQRTTQHELDSAQYQLAKLNHQRAAYEAYQVEQRRLAALRRQRERERLQRLREQQQQQQSSGGGGGSTYSPPPPSGGSWTAAKGRNAAARARSQVGWPYAWAGGGAFGPSRGVCDPSNGAPNDCNVIGYDCSGLAMFAWGASWWAHYAATQFSQAGRVHPGAGQLLPGDLIFWSFNGHVSGIHHVAIYIGGGQMVEAPYSGGYVQVSSIYEYGGFFGATRPGS
jgi:cell wall-associated NlpC family hydrolase